MITRHVVVLPAWSVISDARTQLLCGVLPRLRRRFLKAGQWRPHGERESRKTCPTNTSDNHWRRLSSASAKVEGAALESVSLCWINNFTGLNKDGNFRMLIGLCCRQYRCAFLCQALLRMGQAGQSWIVVCHLVPKMTPFPPIVHHPDRLLSIRAAWRKWLKTQTSAQKELLTLKECLNKREGLKHQCCSLITMSEILQRGEHADQTGLIFSQQRNWACGKLK